MMAKSQETFRKRQRERMLREKAQLKRQRREDRREEKKHTPDSPETLDPDQIEKNKGQNRASQGQQKEIEHP